MANRHVAWITGLLSILILISPITWAAGIQLKTDLGYGGYVAPGCWNRFRIQVKGATDQIRVEVLHQAQGKPEWVSESFPCQNESWIEAPVFAGEDSSALKVRLIRDGQILGEQKVALLVKVFPGHLILTVDTPASIQQTIEASLQPIEPILVVPLTVNELPTVGLSYDGVSGLVMADPGPVLTPVQIDALRAWLSGGGRLLLYAIQPSLKSMAKGLLDSIPPHSASDLDFIPIGLGGITLIRGDLTTLSWSSRAQRWRQLLALKPYLKTPHFTASRSFPNDESAVYKKSAVSLKSSRTSSGIILILMGWGAGALLIAFLTKRRPVAALLSYALLSSIIAFPVAGWLAGIWQRGAIVHSRAVLLPESNQVLLNIHIRLNLAKGSDFDPGQSSPWGLNFRNGVNESGTITPQQGGLLAWNHHLAYPSLVVRSSGLGFMELVGYQVLNQKSWPVETLLPGAKKYRLSDGSKLTRTGMILWARGQFWQWEIRNGANSEWQMIYELPAWLQVDREWLIRLQQLGPELEWLIGRGELPDFKFEVQGNTNGEVIWAMPLPKGGL